MTLTDRFGVEFSSLNAIDSVNHNVLRHYDLWDLSVDTLLIKNIKIYLGEQYFSTSALRESLDTPKNIFSMNFLIMIMK